MDLSILDFPVDFQGQKLVDTFALAIVSIATVVSLLFAFALQDIVYFLYVFTPFIGISLIVVLPNYTKYNEHPVKFLQRPVSKINISL